MPTNLPPDYFAIEKQLKIAQTAQEKIALLNKMLAVMPHHKGTDKLQADIRAKIAKLKKEVHKKSAKKTTTYHIAKEGVAQVLLPGFTNSGKSSILAKFTNATTLIADYQFSTVTPTIGMLQYENNQIQLVDLPAIKQDFTKKWFRSLAITADVLLIVIDLASQEDQLSNVLHYLESLLLDDKKMLVAANKMDIAQQSIQNKFNLPVICVSAKTGEGFAELKNEIYRTLKIVCVYTKEPGKKADFDDAIVLPESSTLVDAAINVHKDFSNKLKYARIRGQNKYEGQKVEKNYLLKDGDVIEFHI